MEKLFGGDNNSSKSEGYDYLTWINLIYIILLVCAELMGIYS